MVGRFQLVELSWLLPLLPLVCSGLIASFGRRLPGQGAYIGIASIGFCWLLSVGMLIQSLVQGLHPPSWGRAVDWALAGASRIQMGLAVDGLALAMLLVVTTVSLLVHIYSVGYMKGDERYTRFFAFLQLFSFSMLTLVLADNLLLLYISWEMVGLSSYLLIGFWFQKPSAMRAAKKAFMVTRVGDMGLFLGLLLLYRHTGTSRFSEVFAAVPDQLAVITARMHLPMLGEVALPVAAIAALLIFFAAMGKSAQFPLHVWLPDAMEGPTPVSALIHAATMVAAGVYLVARMYPVFHYTDHGSIALTFVAVIGAITAIVAATIGIVTNDFKRVLAYSTISQLGYMMMGLGVGGYTAGMFHLFTHAFFKAGLFLGSGSVIHGTGVQDIWKMGGLARKMPVTYVTFLVSMLALAGIFPLAGFWSKDEILLHAYVHMRPMFYVGVLGAFLTAFYMARLLIVAFLGNGRDADVHAHESPRTMTVPLVVLAVLSVAAGFVNTPWLPLFHHYVSFGHQEPMGLSLLVAGAGTAAGLGGLAAAYAIYYWRVLSAESLAKAFRPSYVLFKRGWYVDELLYGALVRPMFAASSLFARVDSRVVDGLVNLVGWLTLALSIINNWFDRLVVDGLVNLVGYAARWTGWLLARLQTGLAQTNVLLAAIGFLVIIWALVYR